MQATTLSGRGKRWVTMDHEEEDSRGKPWITMLTRSVSFLTGQDEVRQQQQQQERNVEKEAVQKKSFDIIYAKGLLIRRLIGLRISGKSCLKLAKKPKQKMHSLLVASFPTLKWNLDRADPIQADL